MEDKKRRLIDECGLGEYVLVLVEWQNCTYSAFTCLNNLSDLSEAIEAIAPLNLKISVWIESLEDAEHIDTEFSARWWPPQLSADQGVA